MQFDRVLTMFADFFEREGIRYAVIGGLAVHAWGRVRPTRDVDFAVDADRSKDVAAFAESLGFATVYASDAFSNHEHADPDWGHVDFMYVRDYFARHGLLELFDAIERTRRAPRLVRDRRPDHARGPGGAVADT